MLLCWLLETKGKPIVVNVASLVSEIEGVAFIVCFCAAAARCCASCSKRCTVRLSHAASEGHSNGCQLQMRCRPQPVSRSVVDARRRPLTTRGSVSWAVTDNSGRAPPPPTCSLLQPDRSLLPFSDAPWTSSS